MYLGHRQLGDFLSVQVQCTDANRRPVAPIDAPTMTIYDASGTSVVQRTIPPIGQSNTGLFGDEQLIGTGFDVGHHAIHYSYQYDDGGTVNGVRLEEFEVVAGGHDNGAYTSLYWYDRPEADYIAGKLEGGQTEQRRNPTL